MANLYYPQKTSLTIKNHTGGPPEVIHYEPRSGTNCTRIQCTDLTNEVYA